MCLFSTYVAEEDRRNAKVGDTLTVGIFKGHACLIGDDDKVTCIKSGTTLVVDKVVWSRRLHPATVKQTARLPSSMTITLKRPMRGYSADRFDLPNGMTITLDMFEPGMTLRIPRKVRKDKGVAKPRNLSKVLGLDQIKADIPVSGRRKVAV